MEQVNKPSRRRRPRRVLLVTLATAAIAMLFWFTNCSNGYDSAGTPLNSLGTSSTGVPQMKLSMKITNSSGQSVYDSTLPNQTLTLNTAQAYTVTVSSPTTAPGATLALSLTNLSVVGATAQSIPVSIGTTNIPANTLPQGEYAVVLSANAPNMVAVAQDFSATVTCASPTFTSLAGSTISASGSTNLYNFTVSVAGNGQAPYQCALDPSGVGIVDTTFQDCSQAFSQVYDNYVATRNVAVVVKDACGTALNFSQSVNLSYAEPGMPGNTFIYGVTSNASGSASGDARADGVTYLATNAVNPNPVIPMYSNGQFSITAAYNYNMTSSVNFGVKISLSGITGNPASATSASTLSVAGATITGFTYSTDQNGDAQPATSYNMGNCVLSNQGVNSTYVAGSACPAGESGSTSGYSVEVWGHYVCTNLNNPTGAINMTGDFDGIYLYTGGCTGGGQEGGGPPVEL